jgi:hypothetical protein
MTMNRLAAGVLCVVAVACGSPAPNPSPPSAPLPAPLTSFALTGRITDATTSGPIAEALVEAINGQNISQSATSDGTGAYRIAGIRIAGYAVRVRRSGYDSAFRGINLNGDTSADFQLTPLMTTLAGTWAGAVSFSTSTGSPLSSRIPEATLTQAGSTLSSMFVTPLGPTVRFSGTLQDPSAIGVIGASTPCQGTAAFTGTTNWTTMSLIVPQITLDCGTVLKNMVLSLVKQQ